MTSRGPVSKRFTWGEVVPFPDNPPISETRVKRLRAAGRGYSEARLGTPELSDNAALAFPNFPADTVFVLDGNTRRRIAELEGELDRSFIGKLWRGLSLAEMHATCRGVNDKRTVKPAEDFKRSVSEGDVGRGRLAAVVEETGWEITYERQRGGFSCTREPGWIWGKGRRGPLVRTLETYEQAFGPEPASGQANVIKGIGAFWLLYPEADADRLGSVLASEGLTVKALYDAARQRRIDLNMTYIYDGFVDVLRHRYNKGLRSGRLPERRMGAGGKGWTE